MKTELEAAASVMAKMQNGQREAFEKCIAELGERCRQLHHERDELLETLNRYVERDAMNRIDLEAAAKMPSAE